MSWLDRLTGGFKKTADRLGENLTGFTSKSALDTATLAKLFRNLPLTLPSRPALATP